MTRDRPTVTSTREPGWYPSPDADSTQRWWNGTSWTAATQVVPEPEVLDRAEMTRDRRRKAAGLLVAGLGVCLAGLSIDSMVVNLHERSPEPGRATVEAMMIADDAPGRCSTTASFSVGDQRYVVTEPADATGTSLCDHVGERVPVSYSTSDPGDGSAEIQHPGLYVRLDTVTMAGAVGGLLLVAAGTGAALKTAERRRR